MRLQIYSAIIRIEPQTCELLKPTGARGPVLQQQARARGQKPEGPKRAQGGQGQGAARKRQTKKIDNQKPKAEVPVPARS